MLRAIIPGAPETAGTVVGVGTVAAGAPTIPARFTLVSVAVGDTAAVLPQAIAGMWFVVTTDGATTGKLFTYSGDGGYVGGASFDNTTATDITVNKALLLTCPTDGIWYGVALG